MSDIRIGEIAFNGLWKNNPALVQLLGLCPLLAVTGSVVNALGLALATMLVLTGSNLVVSLIRNHVSDAIKIPAFVIIIATFTTCTELLMKAFTYELYLILGIFIPLIVTNCAILGRAEAFASKNGPLSSMFDGLMMSVGFAGVLLAVGALREIIGSGTLFANMDLIFGAVAVGWKLQLFGDNYSFLVAILPPGAFIVTGFIIAFKKSLDDHFERRRKESQIIVKGSKRVRTTGKIS